MPNIEKLANQSVYFKNFYVHPVCAPTRASLFTGRNFLRTGVWGVHGTRDYLHLSEQTFAQVLQTNGYRTGLFGKWHNGLTDGYLPWHRGFHEACMVDLYNYIDNKMTCNGVEFQTQGWATARITDRVLDFISRQGDSSFGVMVPFMAPHLGKVYPAQDEYWHAPETIVNKYLNKGLSDQLARLYAMIDFMDVQIGRILQALEKRGLRENTVVMFFSDNGPIGNHLMSEEDWNRRNVHHFRGNKGDVYENGIRVPLFVSWPGVFTPSTRSSALITVEDIFPTILELIGSRTNIRHPIDGRSLVPLLISPDNEMAWSGRTLYFTKAAPDWTREHGVYKLLPNQGRDKSVLRYGDRGAWAIRKGKLKFSNNFGTRELFNLETDPTESCNINDESTKQQLENEAIDWWNSMLEEDHSFSMPIYYIGLTLFSEFYLMGAIEASTDFIIRSHNIEGQPSPGSYLKYRVIVHSDGIYSVNIDQWASFMGELSVQVSCGEERAFIKGHLTQGYIGSLVIPFVGTDCSLELKVETGQGFFQAQRMTLTLET
eukprot:g5709.t1